MTGVQTCALPIFRGIYGTSIQLVRTCLLLNWKQDKKSSSVEEAHASFVEVNTNGMSRDFLRIDLVKSHISYIRKRKDPSGSGLIFDKRPDRTSINPFYSISSKAGIQQSLSQNQVTIRTLLKRNKECQSFIILSASNCFQMGPFNDVKYYNDVIKKESMKRDSLIPIRNSLGPLGLGRTPQIALSFLAAFQQFFLSFFIFFFVLQISMETNSFLLISSQSVHYLVTI